MNRLRPLRLFAALFVACLVVGCGSGGGTTPPTFTLQYEAPGGTGLADGQVNGVRYLPTIERDYTFAAGVDVRGQVTDGDGAVLVNARVSFRPSRSAPDVDSDRTDDTGMYNVTLSAGRWVAVVDSGLDSLGTLVVSGLDVSPPAVIDIQFPAAEAFSGIVRDPAGAAVGNAELEFSGRTTESRVRATTDGSGAYGAALLPDTYDVVVTPTGPAAATLLKQRFTVQLLAGPAIADFTMTAGVRVSGAILDAAGAPLREDTRVRVLLSGDSDFFAPDSVRADKDTGLYSIGPVPAEVVTFEVRAPGDTGLPQQQFDRAVAGPATQTEDFTLSIGVILSGRMLMSDGATPARDVEIQPVPTDGSPAPADKSTDDQGLFAIALFPGTYRIEIDPNPDSNLLPEVRTLTITASTVLDVTLEQGVVLRGTILQPDGRTPAEDIRVSIDGRADADDKTDGDGNYSILAPIGTHTLTLTANDGQYEDMALTPVAGVVVASPGPVTQNVTLALATTGSTVVTGVVMAPDGLTPVPGAEVLARDGNGDTMGRALADASGYYVLVIP